MFNQNSDMDGNWISRNESESEKLVLFTKHHSKLSIYTAREQSCCTISDMRKRLP